MIVRNILNSLRSRNAGTLSMELFIVVLGVFLGIQVSNWNDDRKDDRRALSYLERIRADLEADIQSYEERVTFWNQVREYGDTSLAYAATGNKKGLSDWAIILAYFHASQLAEFFTSDATYEELKSEGALELIRRHELRRILAEYYTTADNPALSERPAYREHVRGIIPLSLQSYIWSGCYYSSDGIHQELRSCPAPPGATGFKQVLETLRSNIALTEELRYWMSTMQVAILMAEGRLDRANEIREIIEAEIED